MAYEHVISLIEGAWQIRPTKMHAVVGVVDARLRGVPVHEGRLEEYRASQEERRRRARDESGVAVIPIHGVIANRMNVFSDMSGGTSAEQLRAAIDAAVADNKVGAIILDIDSPGGSAAGTGDVADRVRAGRDAKPIVAVVDEEGASAAYKIASQATEIVVAEGAMVGSIGTLMVHLDRSEQLAEEGLKYTFIHAGEYKVEGNSTEPLGDEAREYYQEIVDGLHRQFEARVAKGRNVPIEQVRREFGQGRVVSAEEAIRRGMADAIGTLDDTIRRLGRRRSRRSGPRASRLRRELDME